MVVESRDKSNARIKKKQSTYIGKRNIIINGDKLDEVNRYGTEKTTEV